MRALAPRSCGSLLVVAGVLCATACAPSPTQLVVVVDTDLQVPAELDAVTVAVSSDSGVMEEERQPLASASALPLTVTVVPSGDFLGPIEVVARGSLDGTVVVTRRARVTLVRGESLLLRLHLVARCVGVTCDDDESCGESGCEPVEIYELPPWPGSPPRLGADAGMLDAGRRDASTDAAMRDASNPCGDASQCDDGLPCTTDSCSVEGRCVHAPDDSACDDGEECTADRCDPDAGCVVEPTTAACNDGTFCNGSDRCAAGTCSMHDGDPCAAPTVCDEAMDRCSGCLTDADCPDDSIGAWGACAWGDTCAETGSRSRTVRDYACSDGACVPTDGTENEPCTRETDGMGCGVGTCSSFGTCTYADACVESGAQSRTCTDLACGSGTCRTTMRSDTMPCTRDTDGASCGAGVACRTGSCVSCAPTLSGSFGTLGTTYMTGVAGSGSSLTFTDGSTGMPMGAVTAAGATFSGGGAMPICIWQVLGMGNRLRFVDWDGTTVRDVVVSGASVSGTAAPPCNPSPYGCFPPCLARVVGTGSTLQLTFGDSTTGAISFGCP